jgi:metal-responsive CopG/Arc/MetJ family transcriptional regulator
MKTAISIADDIFASAEKFAKRTNRSRSQVFSDALKEYPTRHTAVEVTEAMNRVCAAVGEETDELPSAQRALSCGESSGNRARRDLAGRAT